MNRWLQSKIYQCPLCGAEYLHDKAHGHAVFFCRERTNHPGGRHERTDDRRKEAAT